MTKEAGDVKVSVVIPTKNAGPQLRSVLDAVINQQTDWPFEVLVIDSGSTDGTVDLVKLYSSVRLIEISASEFEHSKTRNFAIANHLSGKRRCSKSESRNRQQQQSFGIFHL